MILIAALAFSGTAFAQTSIPSEVRARVIVLQIDEALSAKLRIPTTSACDSEMTSAGASGLAAW
jgi:hypothetical protein